MFLAPLSFYLQTAIVKFLLNIAQNKEKIKEEKEIEKSLSFFWELSVFFTFFFHLSRVSFYLLPELAKKNICKNLSLSFLSVEKKDICELDFSYRTLCCLKGNRPAFKNNSFLVNIF